MRLDLLTALHACQRKRRVNCRSYSRYLAILCVSVGGKLAACDSMFTCERLRKFKSNVFMCSVSWAVQATCLDRVVNYFALSD